MVAGRWTGPKRDPPSHHLLAVAHHSWALSLQPPAFAASGTRPGTAKKLAINAAPTRTHPSRCVQHVPLKTVLTASHDSRAVMCTTKVSTPVEHEHSTHAQTLTVRGGAASSSASMLSTSPCSSGALARLHSCRCASAPRCSSCFVVNGVAATRASSMSTAASVWTPLSGNARQPARRQAQGRCNTGGVLCSSACAASAQPPLPLASPSPAAPPPFPFPCLPLPLSPCPLALPLGNSSRCHRHNPPRRCLRMERSWGQGAIRAIRHTARRPAAGGTC